jgi:glycosyltransferase involved in cell wall biosynthesis
VREAFFVVPDGIDDPSRPSGGNAYDRHLRDELAARGRPARELAVAGFWDGPEAAALVALDAALRPIPDGAVVLIDGLIASVAPEVVVPQAGRLHLVALVHMPFGLAPAAAEARERERAALTAAAAVVTTSEWTRRELTGLYDLPADRVRVAEPGVEPAAVAPGSEGGGSLLCVGAVTFAKGHDLLLDALASLPAPAWTCACVGSLDRDPAVAAELRRRSREAGLDDRLSFPGTLVGDDLDRAYGSADLLVVASRAETYGMVVTEALARGLPVVAAEVGGVGEALGEGADGSPSGVLVAPEDPAALVAALRAWLEDPALRARLRRSALERRRSLPTWSDTAASVAAVLAEVGA